MRSIVPRLENPRASARRAHSVSCSPLVPGTALGRPIATFISSSFRRARGGRTLANRHQVLDRLTGVVEEALLAAEAIAGVGAHHQRVDLEGETLGVLDPGDPRLALELAQPGVERGGDRIADGAGTVVVLGRGGGPEAAAGVGVDLVEVALGERPQPRRP